MTQAPSRAVQLLRSLLQVGPLLIVAACGGNGSSSSATAPGTPTLDSATAGDTQAVLAFTASTSGGTATTYNADCSATGATTRSVTGSSSPITVTGMTNGTTYTCGVTAINSAGSASSASKTVTPVAASSAPGTPTLNSATAGDGQAVLAFTASTSGGTATTYSGNCSATGETTRNATGSSSPITVTSMTNTKAYTCTVTATNSAGSATSASKSVTPVASSSGGGGTSTTVDTTALPVGTSKVITTVPTSVGYLYSCGGTSPTNPGNDAQGWISSDGTTYNLVTKMLYAVTGANSWASTFTNTIASAGRLDGNGLPAHTTGTFPITNDTNPQAFQYDKNPNKILTNTIAWSGLPSNPTVNATPTCLGTGAVGVFLTGARMFAAYDARGRDARAWEVTDACEGHPQQQGAYHYHSLPKCGLAADVSGQHSAVIGYAADGFAVYGPQGDGGKTIANSDLDICHGHTDTTVTQYHYHTTETFPYTIGCYRGTPITSHN